MQCITSKCSIWYICFTPGILFSRPGVSLSGQARPLKPGNRKLHSRETSSALTGYVPLDKQVRQGHRPDVCSPAGWGQSRRWRGETGCFKCHVAGKCVANQTMVVEERFEGWWGPANSSLGARINAIILFHSRKHWRTFPVLKLKIWWKWRVPGRRMA